LGGITVAAMGRTWRRKCLAALGAAGALLAFPSLALAHQTVTIKDSQFGKMMEINGDDGPDLVTVDYDPNTGEFVIGHDILDPIPPECKRIKFQEIRCPTTAVHLIFIRTGRGADTVRVGESVVGRVYLSVDLGPDNDKFEGAGAPAKRAVSSASQAPGNTEVVGGSGADRGVFGSTSDRFLGGPGTDKAYLGAGRDTASMGGGSDKAYGGPGPDTLKGGGSTDKLFGEGGPDLLLGGGAADKLLAGPGNDQCNGGAGSGKEISC
jgi:hypothetical protein